MEEKELKGLWDEFFPVAKTVGIIIIAQLGEDYLLSKVDDQLFESKIFLKNNFQITNQFVDKTIIECMSIMEGVYIRRSELIRISLSMLLDEEKELLEKN